MYSKPFAGNHRMSSPYGYRTLQGQQHFHTGIDYAMPENTPLYCCDGGVVVFAGKDQYGGQYVDIVADSDGGRTRYLHMNRIDVRYGDKVKTGQQVGLSGNTGWSTGPHLHLEFVTAINPSKAHINPSTGDFDPNYWAEPTDFDNGVFVGNDKAMKEDLINAIKAEGFDADTEQALINAVYQDNIEYVIKYSGSVPRQNLEEAEMKIAELEDTARQEQKEIISEFTEAKNQTVTNSNQLVEQSNELYEEIVHLKPSDKHKPVVGEGGQSLPIWKRSIYDTARDGAYGLGGILIATGAWDMALEFIQTGDFSEQALTNLLLGVGAGIAGYLQALQKQNRKAKEKAYVQNN